MTRFDARAVIHKEAVQLWDFFRDDAWGGSRRLPGFLPFPLALPLPLDCRHVARYDFANHPARTRVDFS